MHLDIAAVEILSFQPEDYFRTQVSSKLVIFLYIYQNQNIEDDKEKLKITYEILLSANMETRSLGLQ